MAQVEKGESRITSGTKGLREPAWVPYFLKSLERLGEVRAAAAEAGVDFTSAYARRKAHPDFAVAWDGALERFRAGRDEGDGAAVAAQVEEIRAVVTARAPFDSLGTNGLDRPTPNPSRLREGGDRARRLALGGNGRWGQAREKIFFEELMATGSVRRAASAAGVSTQAVYARRRKNRHFATKWDAIKEIGTERLSDLLVEAGNRTFDPETEPLPECEAMPKVSVAEAIKIVQLHGSRAQKQAFAEEEPNEEEVDAARERIIARLERMVEREWAELETEGWQRDADFPDRLIPPGWVRVADTGGIGAEPE